MQISSPVLWPQGLPRSQPINSRCTSTWKQAVSNVDKAIMLFGCDTEAGKPKARITCDETGSAVALWFMWDNAASCIAIDRYDSKQANLQSIYHIIEAERTKIRHGGLNIVRQSLKATAIAPSSQKPLDPFVKTIEQSRDVVFRGPDKADLKLKPLESSRAPTVGERIIGALIPWRS